LESTYFKTNQLFCWIAYNATYLLIGGREKPE